MNRPSLVRGVVITGVLVFALILWGGYAEGWRWTGLRSHVTLWEWLQVIALPLAFAASPLLLGNRRALRRRHRHALAAGLGVFAVLVMLGYLIPLPWTGFTGNTLWDWLQLMLLPFVIGTVALWPRPEEVGRTGRAFVTAAAALFIALVAAGYLVPWRWTGFTGNTVWDWLKLLLLPAILPTLVVPALIRRLPREPEPDSEPAPGQRRSS